MALFVDGEVRDAGRVTRDATEKGSGPCAHGLKLGLFPHRHARGSRSFASRVTRHASRFLP
jgi:hypothetical protein